jgi:hypothetical protein
VDCAAETNLLTLSLDLVTGSYDIRGERELDAPLTVKGKIIAECIPVDQLTVLHTSGPIPVRFAKHYLPLIGIPAIPTVTTREQIISQFGEPAAQGGGYQSKSVFVPEWVRYTLDHCYLRFAFAAGLVTDVTIMSRTGPFAAQFP